ncbi:MAG: hypothetical protein U9Q98_10055 [Bacteroidota bacterium]|nr:hypothetical protein [Bacteroidota bacterium]
MGRQIRLDMTLDASEFSVGSGHSTIAEIDKSVYYGISSEFAEFPEATKSIRHYFCIGLQRTLE